MTLEVANVVVEVFVECTVIRATQRRHDVSRKESAEGYGRLQARSTYGRELRPVVSVQALQAPT